MQQAASQQPNNRVAQALSCFAWNKDASQFAVCPSSNEIWIYATKKTPNDTSKWERIQVLKEVGSHRC
jgi:hypothetical protein